jgi:ArsR family transcriptional regulator
MNPGLQMKSFIKVMKALSDPNRVRIVKLLEEGELCVCEIQELVGLAQSTVSKHLKILEDGGLVSSQKDGSWINYRLCEERYKYSADLLEHLRNWHLEDPELAAMQQRLPGIDRALICRTKEQEGKDTAANG